MSVHMYACTCACTRTCAVLALTLLPAVRAYDVHVKPLPVGWTLDLMVVSIFFFQKNARVCIKKNERGTSERIGPIVDGALRRDVCVDVRAGTRANVRVGDSFSKEPSLYNK